MPEVSLCMIVKNEEGRLADCLRSVCGLVNDIVVVDTGSTDRTKEVAAEFGARLFDFPWRDDFAAARNQSLRHARGDWAFWLDADDHIDEPNQKKLRQLFTELAEPAGYSMITRGDDALGKKGMSLVRLFKLAPEVRWQYRVHEQIAPALLRQGYPLRPTDIVVYHTGYQSREVLRHKRERNLRLLLLDLADHPNAVATLLHLGMTYTQTDRFADAIPYLERALARLRPEHAEARVVFRYLVDSLRGMGRVDSALRQCRLGLQWFPDDADLQARERVLLCAPQSIIVSPGVALSPGEPGSPPGPYGTS